MTINRNKPSKRRNRMNHATCTPNRSPPHSFKFQTGVIVTILLLSSLHQCTSLNTNTPTSFLLNDDESSKLPFSNSPHVGPIDDATCHVEQLEEANDSQLFTILHDLKTTAFFRNFAVDLSAKCPLVWNKKEKDKDHGKDPEKEETKDEGDSASESSTIQSSSASGFGGSTSSSSSFSSSSSSSSFSSDPFAGIGMGDDDDDGKCEGGLEDADPDETESACHVDLGDDNDNSGGIPWQQSSTAQSPPKEEATEDKTEAETNNEESEPEFECDGGSIADEMDDEEDTPPLCSLTESEITEYINLQTPPQSKTPLQDALSSALNSLNKKMGWDSKTEEETFMWSRTTDPVILSNNGKEPCDDEVLEGRLPDTFWLDMCANIQEGDGVKVVDLTLNPERNTGYNGTHIWRAIYEENCIDIDGNVDQPMCYEERFLYRLLSGLHASTTLSIAKNYYPPNKRKGRLTWEPNAMYFYEQFGDHPEYIRNLHFTYVVLLRALKKSYPILSKFEIQTGNIVDDETAIILLRRLLDSSILKSCSGVFSAFDESMMFRPQEQENESFESKFPTQQNEAVVILQQNFKGVFHNISSILDCVQCQQCKLHGKMAMLGYGTALKILFMTNEELIASSLSRNEIVAFINTIAKMSEALKDVRELTNLYWREHVAPKSVPVGTVNEDVSGSGNGNMNVGSGSGRVPAADPLDAAIGATATLAYSGMISAEREAELVKMALEGDQGLLILAKHYAADLERFLELSQTIGSAAGMELSQPDAIVVGTGLAGLAATLNILDRGGKVVVVEKEHRLGGNSNKASSGINACCPNNGTTTDYLESFIADTTKSAGNGANPDLIRTLVSNSANAVDWLKNRVGVDLSLIAQLGGHQSKRTHRPKNGMVGAEVIYGMQKAVKEYEKSGQVQILTDTRVLNLLRGDDGSVNGVQVAYLKGNSDSPTEIKSPNVILATGGFAADRSPDSYLSKYRPELLKMPATAGSFSTGDGISLATTVGADIVDMDKVQLHPTGWVDPKDPSNPNKILAAELMRGVGGILINDQGQRFCNELGTRAYVTDMMLSHDAYYAEHKKWNKANEIPSISLVLSSSAATAGKKHVDHYTHKGLLTKIEGVEALAGWMEQDVDVLRDTLIKYRSDASKGSDQWGKASFQGAPQEDLDDEVFFAGKVTPVLHYCMGGITIDTEGNVLDKNSNPIKGLHAAGEVAGGVHGYNRLGGNSLLECTVYGTIVGKKIPIQQKITGKVTSKAAAPSPPKPIEKISAEALSKHSEDSDCWVAIHGHVYDLTSFAEEHPPGAESIHKLCGSDGTEAFQSVHNQKMMDDFEEDKVGVFAS